MDDPRAPEAWNPKLRLVRRSCSAGNPRSRSSLALRRPLAGGAQHRLVPDGRDASSSRSEPDLPRCAAAGVADRTVLARPGPAASTPPTNPPPRPMAGSIPRPATRLFVPRDGGRAARPGGQGERNEAADRFKSRRTCSLPCRSGRRDHTAGTSEVPAELILRRTRTRGRRAQHKAPHQSWRTAWRVLSDGRRVSGGLVAVKSNPSMPM